MMLLKILPGWLRLFGQSRSQCPGHGHLDIVTIMLHTIQQLQHCQDIFLKQRLNREHPWISNAGLFKYLKADEEYLGIRLAPKYLHQSYILYQLAQHRNATPQELQTMLRLNPQSLLYYQRLLLQIK